MAVRPRRSASTEPPPGRRAGPGSRSRPTPSSRRSGSTSSPSSRRRAPTCRGSSSATPTRTRSSTYHLAIVERGASVEFDFLGMSFTPLERHGEGRIVESICELLPRGHVERILLSQDVCHDSPAPPLRRQRLHVPRRDVPAAAARGGRLRRRDPDDHGRQPAAAPDDRLTDRTPALRPGSVVPLDLDQDGGRAGPTVERLKPVSFARWSASRTNAAVGGAQIRPISGVVRPIGPWSRTNGKPAARRTRTQRLSPRASPRPTARRCP